MERQHPRRPAGVVDGNIDKQPATTPVHAIDHLPQLIQRCGHAIEFRQRRIDGEEIQRSKGTA